MNWLAANWVMLGFRIVVSAGQLLSGYFVGGFIGLVGLVSCWTTWEALRSGAVDTSWRAWAVSMAYCSALWMSGQGVDVRFAQVFVLLFVLNLYVKFNLGRRCTVCGPVFVDVVDVGLYRWIRHPMAFTEIAMVVTLMCGTMTAHNLVAGFIAVACQVAAVVWEEGFLMGFYSYKRYAVRVPYRLVPWLW